VVVAAIASNTNTSSSEHHDDNEHHEYSNSSVSSNNTDHTAPAAPTIVLNQDTGTFHSDGVTSNAALKGGAENGATVIVSGTGTDTAGTAVQFNGSTNASSSNGSWNLTSGALPEGTYIFKATATDQAGNVSGSSGPLQVTLDTTAPTVDLEFVDTGTNTSDNITNLRTLTASTDGVNVAVTTKDHDSSKDSTTPLQTTEATNSGTLTATANLAKDGHYDVTATATDLAGNTATSTKEVTLDTTAPTLTAELQNDTGAKDGVFTKDGHVVVTAESGASVTVTNGSSVIESSSRPVVVDVATQGDGTYHVTATATDAAGNTKTITKDVTVDNVKPTPTIAVEDTGTSSEDRITRDNTVQVGASDNNSASIEVKVDGSVKTPSSGIVTLADGEHTVSVTATDLAGNSASISTGKITIDTVAPTPTIAVEDTGKSNSDGITRDNTVQVGASESGATIEVKVGTETITPNNGIVTLTDGKHTIDVTATDVAGNTKTVTKELTVDTDAAPISVFDAGATLHTSSHTDTLAVVTGKAEAGSTVDISASYGSNNASQTAVATTDGSFTATSTDQGSKTTIADILSQHDGVTLTATSTDLAGNISTATVTSNIIDTHSGSNLFASVADNTVDTATQTGSGSTVSISDVLGDHGAVLTFDVAKEGSGSKVTINVDTNSDTTAPTHASFDLASSATTVTEVLKQLLDVPVTPHHD
jgi:hypothetical protein